MDSKTFGLDHLYVPSSQPGTYSFPPPKGCEHDTTVKPIEGDDYFKSLLEDYEKGINKSIAVREDCRRKMYELSTALSNRELLENKRFIDPSIFLLPFPAWNPELKTAQIVVHGYDMENLKGPDEELKHEIMKMSFFLPDGNQKLNQEKATDLIRGLTEYMYDFTYGPNKKDFIGNLDYEDFLKTLNGLPFFPAKKTDGTLYSYQKNGKNIMVNTAMVEQYRKQMLMLFWEKNMARQKNIQQIGLEIQGRLKQTVDNSRTKITRPEVIKPTMEVPTMSARDLPSVSSERLILLGMSDTLVTMVADLSYVFQGKLDMLDISLVTSYLLGGNDAEAFKQFKGVLNKLENKGVVIQEAADKAYALKRSLENLRLDSNLIRKLILGSLANSAMSQSKLVEIRDQLVVEMAAKKQMKLE